MDDRRATPLCVLGTLEVVRDGEPVRLGSGQQRRLLAVLLVHANEVVSSDRLVDILWGDHTGPSAMHTLQTLVSRLRATLGDERLETRPPGYRLRVASGEVDALRFEELVRVGLGSSERAEVALARVRRGARVVARIALRGVRERGVRRRGGRSTGRAARPCDRGTGRRAVGVGPPGGGHRRTRGRDRGRAVSRASAGAADAGARACRATGRVTARV